MRAPDHLDFCNVCFRDWVAIRTAAAPQGSSEPEAEVFLTYWLAGAATLPTALNYRLARHTVVVSEATGAIGLLPAVECALARIVVHRSLRGRNGSNTAQLEQGRYPREQLVQSI